MSEEKKSWFNPDKPLWLPEGSVRGLLILGLTGAVIVVILKSVVLSTDIPLNVEKLLSALLPAIVLLIKDYINSRSGSQQ